MAGWRVAAEARTRTRWSRAASSLPAARSGGRFPPPPQLTIRTSRRAECLYMETVQSRCVRDGGLDGLEGDAEFGERARRERVGDVEHAEQDVLVSDRLLASVIDRLGKCDLETRRDAADR